MGALTSLCLIIFVMVMIPMSFGIMALLGEGVIVLVKGIYHATKGDLPEVNIKAIAKYTVIDFFLKKFWYR